MTETPTDSVRAQDEDATTESPAAQKPAADSSGLAALVDQETTDPAGDEDVSEAAATDDDDDDEVPGDDGDAPADAPSADAPSAVRPRRSQPSPERLEEEGDVAADYLEELLDIVDLDGDIDIDVENGRASVSVVADSGSERSLRRLVGEDGVVLEALQELTRLAVQARTGERTRLMLDVAGYRAGRRVELEKLAEQAIERVKADGASVSLDPMSPFERKVVHDAVAAAGLRSESEGEDARRHVVVLPANT